MDILAAEEETTKLSPSDAVPHPRTTETSNAPHKKPKTSQHIQSSCYRTAIGCHLLSESPLTEPTQLTAHTHSRVAAGHDKW